MNKLKIFLVVTLAAVLVLSLGACGNKNENTAVEQPVEDKNDDTNNTDTVKEEQKEETVNEELSGKVTISGSTSVEKVGTGLAEEFMALNPEVEVTYEGIGSSAGVKNANEGVTMIGTVSRNLKEKEEEAGMTKKVIGYDGIAVIVNPENGVEDLTKEQVRKIYTGEIKNWKEVGGKDQTIVVVSREDGSGTRGAYEEIVGFEGLLFKDAIIAEGNGNVQTAVAKNPQAIGYVSFTYLNETVKGLKIEGVEPTTENVLAETYTVSRPFLMVFHDDNLSDAAKVFVDFIFTEEGQVIVEDNGAIPVGSDK